MNGIIGKTDSDGVGLAFVCAEGLHEGAVHNDFDNTMAITLYRCFERVYLQTNAERSQLQQEMTFKYAIVPLTKETDYADLLYIQHCLADTDVAYSRRLNIDEIPAFSKSYLSLDNRNIHISIFKCAQDGEGYILRLHNASSAFSQTTLHLNFDCNACFITDMNEDNIDELRINNSSTILTFDPWEIKTLRIR